MSEEIILLIVQYNFLIILFFLIVKCVMYFTFKQKKRTFKNFLYFSESNVRGTKDPKRKTKKIILNVLTAIIVLLLLAQVFIFLSGAFFKKKPEE